jgi:hypothetical protein
MGTGILAWACLLLGPNAPADDVVHFGQRGFQIPITVQPGRRAEVKSLVLYSSRDQGRTWQNVGHAGPDKPGIDFLAKEDGMYWFSIAVIDQSNRQDPIDISRAPVGQKVLIDTIKPQVRLLHAERVGNEVRVSWEAFDEHPDWPTFRLEYKPNDQPRTAWMPLPIHSPSPRGNHTIVPGITGPITVRVAMKDMAGNEGYDERVVPAALGSSVATKVDPGLQRTGGGAPPFEGAKGPLPLPPGTDGPDITARPVGTHGGMEHLAPTPPPVTPGITPDGPGPAAGPLPTVKVVNKREVKLRFGVEKCGPSGLGSVEVYLTADEGATWEKAAPIAVQMPQVPGPGNPPASGSVTVALPRDGIIYGFYIVVKSRLGKGDSAPTSGRAPQVRIEMDTTPPEAILRMPQPDPTHNNQMVFTWTANDRNLDNNPITLEWASKPEGPWEIIGEPKLPNTGSYTWTVTSRIPFQVFLKMTVRDKAGNSSVATTPKAIPMDVSSPIVKPGSVTVE